VPIANEFKVPLTDVAAVFTITLWLRLVGATASGNYQLGFAIPMLVGTTVGLVSVLISLLLSPETKGCVYQSDVVVT
jgi:hypothetical protein